ENLRDHMTDLELIFSMLGEASTTQITKVEHPEGFVANKAVAVRGGGVAGTARLNITIIKSWSGTASAWNKKKARKKFNEMIEYAKAHPKIKHIIFDVTDRAPRKRSMLRK
ncbi:MAG: hypothetical protein WCI27_05360, partial [Candidatus Omnitrophota bacterium]